MLRLSAHMFTLYLVSMCICLLTDLSCLTYIYSVCVSICITAVSGESGYLLQFTWLRVYKVVVARDNFIKRLLSLVGAKTSFDTSVVYFD